MRESKFLEPYQTVDNLAKDYAYGNFCKTICVLQEVKKFSIFNLLHL